MKKTLPLLLLLAVGACDRDDRSPYQQASDAYAAGDYRAAAVSAMNAVQAAPADPRTLVLAARIQLALGRGDQAAALLDDARAAGAQDIAALQAEALVLQGRIDQARALMAANPDLPAAQAALLNARLALLGDDRAEAIRILTEAITAHPTDAPLLTSLGRLRLADGEVAAAAELARRALAADRRHGPALQLAGDLAAAQANPRRALALLDEGLRLRPSDPTLLLSRAAALGDLGRYEEMTTALDRAERSGPASIQLTMLRARLLLAQEDARGAQSLLVPVREQVVALPEGLRLLAEIDAAVGNRTTAISSLRRLVTARPEDRAARLRLAELQLAAGQASEAMDTLAPVVSREDGTPAERRVYAAAAQATGRADAPRLTNAAALPTPAYLADRLGAANLAMQQGNWDRAITLYTELRQHEARPNALILNNLAWAHHQLGRNERAVALARQAYELEPGNASIQDSYGWIVYRSGGDRALALQMLTGAARAAPDNRTIAAHLAEVRGGQ